jgi:hypothetical protein
MDRKFIEGVLLRCFILGFVVLIIWFVFAVLIGPGCILEVYGRMFKQITERQFQVIHYCGMGLLKLFIFVFFLFPYIAMRWTGKNQKSVG